MAFLAATIFIWVFIRLLLLNPNWITISYLYWSASTLGIVALYVFFEKAHHKLTTIVKESLYVGLVSLSAILTLDVFFAYCEPQKNAPLAIKTITSFINAVIFVLLLFRKRYYKLTVKYYVLFLLVLVCLFMFVFYTYSLYRFYDSIYFWVSGSLISV